MAGLITLAVAPLIVLLLIVRRRELREARTRLRDNSVRAARLATAVAGLEASLPAAAAAHQQQEPIAIYGQPRMTPRRWALTGACAFAIAAAGVVGFDLADNAGHIARARAVTADHPSIPTVPVAVLNATQTQGAAGRLARGLERHRVKIAVVGNLVESLPPGLLILYTSGAREQAARLARLLPARAPTIEPINPVVEAAAGDKTKLAVVIA